MGPTAGSLDNVVEVLNLGLARTNPNSGKWKVELRWTSTPSINGEGIYLIVLQKPEVRTGFMHFVHFKADFSFVLC